MASDEPVVRLRHGTTRQRAEAIVQNGPDPHFREPGGLAPAEGFSTAGMQTSYPYGSPEKIALRKALLFPDEGGPAIIEMDVPESIALKANLVGEFRFDPGFGLEELLAAWPEISKRVIPL